MRILHDSTSVIFAESHPDSRSFPDIISTTLCVLFVMKTIEIDYLQ